MSIDNKPFTKWGFDDMAEYAKAHGEIEWFKNLINSKVEHKVYPKIDSISKSGKKSQKFDRTAEPKTELVDITFVEVKKAFNAKFNIYTPTKEKPVSMKDKLAKYL